MCNEFCKGWDFEQACRLAGDTGYDGIEIAPFTIAERVTDIAPDQRRELRQAAARHGLHIVGLHWLLVKPEGLHLNSPRQEIRDETVAYLGAEIDFCADIGGTHMIIGSPKQRNVLPGQDFDDIWRRSVQAMRKLAARAEERNVCLCIEPLGRTETNFIDSAAEARCFVEAVGRPAFKMMLDVKAMNEDDEPMPDIIRKSAAHLAHFHANDANRLGPGFGDTDFRPIAAALNEIGYDGYVSVEVFDFSAGPQAIARESLRYLREAFG
jgi:sugar phosphate isomerase/epimerase